uniref:ATPbinding Cassette (ABC) superfamily putative n=1 Tax=Albugo laibachii Nc14 TaxID=890382 RepID=F0W801_9STRA|nr:ATPbinding Cassette (ABC) superfamily putative [Albugo laibachii Nc14]|eukprot:CCA17254.1 ATPbinding Cassette (ABC) superfamily putative [Albugo laibachii Nc14]
MPSSRHENGQLVYLKEQTPRNEAQRSNIGQKSTSSIASVHFYSLYRYSNWKDKALLFLSCVLTTVNGSMLPCMSLILDNAFKAFQSTTTASHVDVPALTVVAFKYLNIGILVFGTDSAACHFLALISERQVKAMRERVLKKMLYMNVSWHDQQENTLFWSRIHEDTTKIRDAMNLKLHDVIKYSTQFWVGYVIAFSKAWDLSLVMASVVPVIAVAVAYMLRVTRGGAQRIHEIDSEADAVVEETVQGIRTITSLNAGELAVSTYKDKAEMVEQENMKQAKPIAGMVGLILGTIWLMFSIGFWYGERKVLQGNVDSSSDMFQAVYAIVVGTLGLAELYPNLSAITRAKVIAVHIFRFLETTSTIDASSKDGEMIGNFHGNIHFEDVSFSYPTRPNVPVLQKYNLRIKAGQRIAFVGPKGCGKSSVIALLERFYTPDQGKITLDGEDIQKLRIRWLRSQIGLVTQNPVLFVGTIRQNIDGGILDITPDDVIDAAKLTGVHDFIASLPEQYETLVSDQGASLSAGQKQQIAIARAIVRKPAILILDQATSSLDVESEKQVHKVLKHLTEQNQMTAIYITHRLKTIKHVDKIVVMAKGTVVEEGTHDALLQNPNGMYRNMWTEQMTKPREEFLNERASAVGNPQHYSVFQNTKGDDQHSSGGITWEKAKELIRPEKRQIGYGLMGAAVLGFSYPILSIFIGKTMADLTRRYANFARTQDRKYLDNISGNWMAYGLSLMAVAYVIALSAGIKSYYFRYMHEKLYLRLRIIHFSSLCRQNIAFFDQNSTGKLTSEVATCAAKGAALSGEALGGLAEACFVTIASILVSLSSGSWILTMILLCIYPLFIGLQLIRFRKAKKAATGLTLLNESASLASEALHNIKTVAALGCEEEILASYSKLVDQVVLQGKRRGQWYGIVFEASQTIVLLMFVLIFWYGGRLVHEGSVTLEGLIRTLMTVLMVARGVQVTYNYFCDTEGAVAALDTILSLRDRNVPIDSFDTKGDHISAVAGDLQFRNVSFAYTGQANTLENFNLHIPSGKTVVMCGPVGGGLSTCFALLQRFYDPSGGHISLDGVDIKSLNPYVLRSQFAFVAQEPILFSGSISENIAYSVDASGREDNIIQAATLANAHEFISALPDQYNTQIGMWGAHLSTDQKQRIAIARAFFKKAPILLLDEVTTAMDSEGERLLSEALDNIRSSRKCTTLIISNRLSSTQNADLIYVVNHGQVKETGTHLELLNGNGMYANFIRASNA